MFRRKKRHPAARALDISSGAFVQKIEGEAVFQEARRRLAGGAGRRKIHVKLSPEPADRDQPERIVVSAVDEGAPIGTLPADVVDEWGAMVVALGRDQGRPLTCRAFLVASDADPAIVDAHIDSDFDRLTR